MSDVWTDKSPFWLSAGSEARGILRGGAYSHSRRQARTSYQGFQAIEASCHGVGFRCAMDALLKDT